MYWRALAVIAGVLTLGCLFLAALVTTTLLGRQLEGPSAYDLLARVESAPSRRRADVVPLFSDAWYHGVCRLTGDYIDDVFVYGPKSRENALYFGLLSKRDARGDFIVVNYGTLPELVLYEDCLPPILRATPTSTLPTSFIGVSP